MTAEEKLREFFKEKEIPESFYPLFLESTKIIYHSQFSNTDLSLESFLEKYIDSFISTPVAVLDVYNNHVNFIKTLKIQYPEKNL